MHEHFAPPIGQVIFSWGQLKTEMYWPTGQLDFKIFFLPCTVDTVKLLIKNKCQIIFEV